MAEFEIIDETPAELNFNGVETLIAVEWDEEPTDQDLRAFRKRYPAPECRATHYH